MDEKELFTLAELIVLLGWKYEQRKRLRRLLHKAGMPPQMSKGARSKGYYAMRDLQQRCPAIWQVVYLRKLESDLVS